MNLLFGLGVKGHKVAECTPLFIRLFAGSTDRESVIACIVCRDGPVFTLVGVLCAGSSRNGDTLDLISTWLLAVNFGPRPLYLVADSRVHVQDMIGGVREPSLYNTACQGERCDPTCVG